MNETYRADLADNSAVVVRIARQPVPWFVDESHLIQQAHEAGVPTAEVLGLEHLDVDGQLLSFSIQQFKPVRSLDRLFGELAAPDLERLVADAGEVLARVHSVIPDPDRGIRHDLHMPDERDVARAAGIVADRVGRQSATVVERGADFLRQQLTTRSRPPVRLVHGDFCPKNILIHNGAIVGFIDWEFAGPAPQAYDFAQWEVDAGHPWDDRLDVVRRGYARIANPESAEAGWTPLFAIDWTLEKLGWQNPASPEQFARCIDLIERYVNTAQR